MRLFLKLFCRFLLPMILSPFAAGEDQLHPLFRLENLYPEQEVELKISAMAFEGGDLFVTVMTPDRLNKAPFLEGEIFKVTGPIGNSDRSKVKAHRLMGGLYEPTAIAVFQGKIYVGEKDRISRLEDRDGDGFFSKDEKVVLIDGISQPNFHTYYPGHIGHGGLWQFLPKKGEKPKPPYGLQRLSVGKSSEIPDDFNEPLAEAPVGYPPAMPDLNLSGIELDALVGWIETLK